MSWRSVRPFSARSTSRMPTLVRTFEVFAFLFTSKLPDCGLLKFACCVHLFLLAARHILASALQCFCRNLATDIAYQYQSYVAGCHYYGC